MSSSIVESGAFEFIESLDRLSSQAELLAAFSRRVAPFGFTDFLITGLPSPLQKLDQHIVLSGWSEEWFRRYMSMGYYTDDPMARHTRNTVKPFLWSEVSWQHGTATTSRSHQVMNEAQEFGLADGFSVPIYGMDGEQSCVTMGGRQLDIPPRGKEAISLMSMYLHHRCRALFKEDRGGRELGSKSRRRLTRRETECLTWIAVGKTDWEVGSILGITESTARQHIDNARMKLSAKTRTHAVACALQEKLIAV